MGAPGVTGMVICLNEAKRIEAALSSLAFCDEILVIDSGSTDGTQELVRKAGARLVVRPFVSWNDQKDFGREASTGAWVLNLDADEVVSPELRAEIEALRARGFAGGRAGYRMPFRNHLRGVWIKSCGFYPDRHLRLVERARSRWDVGAVHDRVVVDGAVGELSGHVDHYSFESIADYLEKSNIYALAFARRAHAAGREVGPLSILGHTLARFVRSYVFQRGFLDGALGATMAGLQAAGTFQKYARLWEMNRFGAPPAPVPALGDPWAPERIADDTRA